MRRVPPLPHVPGVESACSAGVPTTRSSRGSSPRAPRRRATTASRRPRASRSGYEHLERCDPLRDLLVAEVDGRPVAYSRVWWDDEADGPRLYKQVCFLDPLAGGRGIGSALLAWNLARLEEIAAEHDAPEQLHETFLGDGNLAGTALVRGAGFGPVTYAAEMVRPSVDDLPDHPLPEGLEIRPVTEDQLRTIWEADVEAFRDHWGFVEPSEESYQSFLAFPYNDFSRGRSRGTTRASRARSSPSSTPRRTPGTATARLDRGDLDVTPLAAARGGEGPDRGEHPRAGGARDDGRRARRPHREPERRLRPVRGARVRGSPYLDDLPQASLTISSASGVRASARSPDSAFLDARTPGVRGGGYGA